MPRDYGFFVEVILEAIRKLRHDTEVIANRY